MRSEKELLISLKKSKKDLIEMKKTAIVVSCGNSKSKSENQEKLKIKNKILEDLKDTTQRQY